MFNHKWSIVLLIALAGRAAVSPAPPPQGPGNASDAVKQDSDPLAAYPKSDGLADNVRWHKQIGENEIRMSWFLYGKPNIAMVCKADLFKRNVWTSREVWNWASQGTHTRELSYAQVRTLVKIAKSLPPSAKTPELKNLIIVSVPEKGQAKTYLYNRLDLPRDIIRLYDLTGADLDTETKNAP